METTNFPLVDLSSGYSKSDDDFFAGREDHQKEKDQEEETAMFDWEEERMKEESTTPKKKNPRNGVRKAKSFDSSSPVAEELMGGSSRRPRRGKRSSMKGPLGTLVMDESSSRHSVEPILESSSRHRKKESNRKTLSNTIEPTLRRSIKNPSSERSCSSGSSGGSLSDPPYRRSNSGPALYGPLNSSRKERPTPHVSRRKSENLSLNSHMAHLRMRRTASSRDRSPTPIREGVADSSLDESARSLRSVRCDRESSLTPSFRRNNQNGRIDYLLPASSASTKICSRRSNNKHASKDQSPELASHRRSRKSRSPSAAPKPRHNRGARGRPESRKQQGSSPLTPEEITTSAGGLASASASAAAAASAAAVAASIAASLIPSANSGGLSTDEMEKLHRLVAQATEAAAMGARAAQEMVASFAPCEDATDTTLDCSSSLSEEDESIGVSRRY